jgi:hypothetical protein
MRPPRLLSKGERLVAKTHPQEQVLYARISEEKISIHPFVWDTLYLYLGDHISAINFIVSYYLEENTPVTIEDSRRILRYTRAMTDIVDKVLHHDKVAADNARLEKIKNENMTMHPVVRELVSHYMSNDIMGINYIVSFHLDPMGEEPVPVEDAQKILNYVSSMASFLDRLRKATQQEVHF